MTPFFIRTFVTASLCLAGTLATAQHLHFVAGAEAPVPGTKLIAVNSNDFVAATRFVQTMTFTNQGTHAGYYLANHSFIVAAATAEHGGPEAGAPALGAWIHMGMVSVAGPAGGEIGYWEVGATNPTITLAAGQTGTNLWRISENDGSPGSDPYGHIHGRRFTATKPGLYLIGFRFVDLSAFGITGAPIHAPSEIVYVFYQAGITVSAPAKDSGSFSVEIGTVFNRVHTLQWAEELSPSAVWTDGPSITGDNHFKTLTDATASGPRRFYRVVTTVP